MHAPRRQQRVDAAIIEEGQAPRTELSHLEVRQGPASRRLSSVIAIGFKRLSADTRDPCVIPV